MDDKLVEEFADLLEEHGLKVYRGYSGRAMYGRGCLGVVIDELGELVGTLCWIAREDEEEKFMDLLGYSPCGQAGMSMDSFGRQTIVYWPAMEMKDERSYGPRDDDDA